VQAFRLSDSYFPYLILSVFLHALAFAVLFFTSQPLSTTAPLIHASKGFSVSFESSATGNDRQSRAQENRQGSSRNANDGGGSNPGLLTKSLGQLKQTIPYPALAASQGIQGTVIVFIALQEGKLAKLDLLSSSGYDILDNQVLQSIRAWQWPEVTAERQFRVDFAIDR